MTERAADVLAALAESTSREEQLSIIQTSWRTEEAATMSKTDAEELLCRLAAADSRDSQLQVLSLVDTERRTIAALDVAVAPIIMQSPALRLVMKAAKNASVSPNGLALCLDSLEEGCFLSAAQAAEIMKVVQAPIHKQFEYWHVVCSRVIDKWRLTESDHTQVCCYYGWDSSYATQIARDLVFDSTSALKLQNKILVYMGRADHTEYARSRKVPNFAARIIASNIKAGSSGTRRDICAVCLENCENGSPLYICAVCTNRLHARCCRSWVLIKGEDDALCPYCRSPVRDGTFSIGELPEAPAAAPATDEELHETSAKSRKASRVIKQRTE